MCELMTMEEVISEYDKLLSYARTRGLKLLRHPDVDFLDPEDPEDKQFLVDLMFRISRSLARHSRERRLS